MACTLVEAILEWAVVPSPPERLIALTVCHRIVLDALTNRLSFCVRTVVLARQEGTVRAEVGFFTLADRVFCDVSFGAITMLIAMHGLLLLYSVDVNVHEWVGAVSILAGIAVISVLTSASTYGARPIVVAFFEAVLSREHIDVLIVAHDARVFWKGGVNVFIEAITFRSFVHQLPIGGANVIDCEEGEIWNL